MPICTGLNGPAGVNCKEDWCTGSNGKGDGPAGSGTCFPSPRCPVNNTEGMVPFNETKNVTIYNVNGTKINSTNVTTTRQIRCLYNDPPLHSALRPKNYSNSSNATNASAPANVSVPDPNPMPGHWEELVP